MKKQSLSRRQFIGSTALAAAGLAFASKTAFANTILSKPDSLINGVQIGVITYSFRSMPSDVESLLKYCVDCNINAIELMGDAAEAYAGIPKFVKGGDRSAYNQAVAAWRASVSMDKFEELRKMYNKAGVKIYAWKPNALDTHNSDQEIDYAFNAGKALGVNHITVELPNDAQTKRLGEFGEKHKIMLGYHAHTQATSTLWDTAVSQSKYNGINLDIGHYVAGTSTSPIPFIEKNYDRITSLHIKDRKFHDGPNQPWGEGDTPIKEVLKLMKRRHYKFPATIELEYNIPNGSDAVSEVKKCRAYAAATLS